MTTTTSTPTRYGIDAYLDWCAGEGIPIYGGLLLDMVTAETADWPRLGVKGAIANFEGRGDFCSMFKIELPPGTSTTPQHHLYEEICYVVEVNPDPTVIEPLAVAVLAAAPHPNAARLFYRWMLTRDTQQWIVAELNRISARKDVKNNPVVWGPQIRFIVSNPADSVHYQDYVHDFNAIFGVGG